MIAMFRHKRPLLASVVLLAGIACLLGRTGGKSLGESNAQPNENKANVVKGKYLGASYCAQCHEKGPTDKQRDDYVLLTEYATWIKQDKHSQAYKKLEEPRALQMGKLMGIEEVTKDDRCLNCHAANVPKEQRVEEGGQAFNIADGVSCDACHGPSSLWIVDHALPSWRKKPMPEKEKLGMIDVRDPVKRSHLCFSCHIGSVAEGKVVTHEMYAAGHPPLPSIEIATFSDQMPRHWRYICEKKPEIRKLMQEVYRIDPDELEKTKLATVSGVLAFRQEMELLAHSAEQGTKARETDHSWPELARFDCYACHHDLKSPSWRQQRGYAGKPGRPGVRMWPLALVKAGLHYTGQDSKPLENGLKDLVIAFDLQPFGKPEMIPPAARKVAGAADQIIKQLSASKHDQVAARRLLRALCSVAQEEWLDYDSARQIAWAFKIIYSELKPRPSNDQEIQAILKALDKELKLTLPSGTGRDILGELKNGLERMNNYEPLKLKQLFVSMAKLLPEN